VKLRQRLSSFADKIAKGWSKVEATVISTVILIIPICLVVITFARYILRIGIPGLQEYTLVLAAYGYFIGAAVASRQKAHVTVTVVDLIRMPESVRHYLAIIPPFVSFVLYATFCYYTVIYAYWISQSGLVIPPFLWPLIVWVFPMPFGLFLISLYELRNLVRTVQSRGSIQVMPPTPS